MRQETPALNREPALVTGGEPTARTDTTAPKNRDDPRIGLEVHPDSTAVGFDDGSQYRAANGVIVEKLN